jgi:hypothetical protein
LASDFEHREVVLSHLVRARAMRAVRKGDVIFDGFFGSAACPEKVFSFLLGEQKSQLRGASFAIRMSHNAIRRPPRALRFEAAHPRRNSEGCRLIGARTLRRDNSAALELS